MSGTRSARVGGSPARPAANRSALKLLPLFALILGACGQRDTDAGPGGVSVGEARALDEAAAMLEQQRLPPGALAGRAPDSPRPSPAPATTPTPAG